MKYMIKVSSYSNKVFECITTEQPIIQEVNCDCNTDAILSGLVLMKGASHDWETKDLILEVYKIGDGDYLDHVLTTQY